MPKRTNYFNDREQTIIATAETLLLESGTGDVTLDDLADELDIAKGTLYKHFSSKDELFLQILIRHELRLANMNAIDDDPSAQISRMLLQILINPQRAMLFNHLEERLAGTASGLSQGFKELYRIRRERMNVLLASVELYLNKKNSALSTRDYLSTIWAMGQGGATLLNSSFYQRYLGRRDTLILALLTQILDLPKLYKKPKVKEESKPDAFSPFGKLPPPVL